MSAIEIHKCVSKSSISILQIRNLIFYFRQCILSCQWEDVLPGAPTHEIKYIL